MNQREIASTIGVSQTTVSLVLKDPNTEKVSPKRRKQILDFIQKVQYSYRPPNGMTGTICYLTPALINNHYKSFYDRFLDGIELAARTANYNVLVQKYDTADNVSVPTGKFDGIIFGGTPTQNIINALGQSKLVLLNSLCKDQPACFDSIEPDEAFGMELAVRHLVENGHSRIAYLSLTPRHEASMSNNNLHPNTRLNAFLNSCRNFNLEYDESLIHLPECGTGFDETEVCIAKALDYFMNLQSRPTAVICFNDLYALILIRQAVRAGLSLPEHLSIIGIDNVAECNLSVPALTSVDHDPSEMCRLAVEMLIRKLKKQDSRVNRISPPASLACRESVAKI